NCVAPAVIKTEILQQVSEEFAKFMLSKIPMGRFGTVEEAAALVAWLASEDCSFSTGAVYDLSGGPATYCARPGRPTRAASSPTAPTSVPPALRAAWGTRHRRGSRVALQPGELGLWDDRAGPGGARGGRALVADARLRAHARRVRGGCRRTVPTRQHRIRGRALSGLSGDRSDTRPASTGLPRGDHYRCRGARFPRRLCRGAARLAQPRLRLAAFPARLVMRDQSRSAMAAGAAIQAPPTIGTLGSRK